MGRADQTRPPALRYPRVNERDPRTTRKAGRPPGGRGAAVAALIGAALAGCGARPDSGRERLVVAAVRQPATALLFVAAGSGCLAAERLDVEEHGFDLGRDALAFMLAGRAEVAIAFETPTVRAAFGDDRLRALTALHSSSRNTRVVARADRGIDGFHALAGKRVGIAQGSNADFFVDLALRFGGVPRPRVDVVNLAPDASVAALAAGELDAAVLSDPYAARAEQALGGAGRTLQTEVYTEVSLLLTREDVLRARQPALRRLVRGLACAERLARERPDEALRLVRPRFPELADADLRAQLARVRWGLGLDHVLLGVLRDEREWMRAAHRLPGGPDLSRLVAREILEEIDPEAVTLLPTAGGER